MDSLSILQDLIRKELDELNLNLHEALKSDSKLLNSVTEFYLKKKGKLVRPSLVLLSAKLCGEISSATNYAAISLELLHNASLIHDDVVDESDERRGLPTVNSVWNNKLAVLVGDFFLSTSLVQASKTGSLPILDVIASLGQELAEGEILQMNTADHKILSEEAYYKVISKKTASLFVACMKCGAVSTNATDDQIAALSVFGEKLGLCFQIRDDIFDYFDNVEIGKPTGNDVREGKITLPLLYPLICKSGNYEQMYELINKETIEKNDTDILIDYAIQNKGIEYAEKKMQSLAEEGRGALSIFKDSPEKDALIMMMNFTIARNI